jgi:prophage DNA circulation protein
VSTVTELVAAIQAMVAGVAEAADDPADRIRVLTALAVAEVPADGDAAAAAVWRRSALAALARASAAYQPGSYDEAIGLRDRICSLLEAEEVIAADAGEDAVASALRRLRGAVDRDLRGRGASLSPLRDLMCDTPQPAIAMAHRLYGDARREEALVEQCGDVPNPCFISGAFKVSAR